MKRAARRALIAAVAAGLAVPAVAAHRATQTLAVSARVSPSATVGFEIRAQPLEITSADIDRGYVEVVMRSRMQVTTTRGVETRPQVVMGIEPRADVFKSVAVSARDAANGHSIAVVDVPATPEIHGTGGQVAEFRYRFEFSKAAREGAYGTAISVAIDL